MGAVRPGAKRPRPPTLLRAATTSALVLAAGFASRRLTPTPANKAYFRKAGDGILPGEADARASRRSMSTTMTCDIEGVGRPSPRPPRRMSDTSNPIYFLHIGKSMGTSIDELFEIALRGDLKRMKKKYHGSNHFDWSFVQMQHAVRTRGAIDLRSFDFEDVDVAGSVDVVATLRHPVDRAVSQFYYSRTLPWMANSNEKARHQTLGEYLDDPDKTWTQPVADGEGGTDFLAGIVPTSEGSWISSDGRETDRKRCLRRNGTAAVLLAASRLESTTWFGIVEDARRSVELLRRTLGLNETPDVARKNARVTGHPAPSREVRDKIARSLPKDMWLYEYARRLFEARWAYSTIEGEEGAYVPPEMPPLPEF
ncbi:hypothetical protein ACHAWF_007543 [Thalassiosira exigua]